MRVYAFDSETFLITPTDKAPKPVCCSWYNGTRGWLTRPGDAETFAIISDPDAWFILQNGGYDFIVMMRWHPELIPFIIRALDEGRVWDTRVREQMWHLATVGVKGYDPFFSLAYLVQKYLGRDISATKQGQDVWRLKYGTLDAVPIAQWPEEARQYPIDDAKNTWDVFVGQGWFQAAFPTEPSQVRSAVVLQAIGAYGFAIDKGIQQGLRTDLETKIVDLQGKIGHLGWTGEGSQKKLGDVVLKAWHLKQMKLLYAFAQQTGVAIDGNAWWSHFTPVTDVKKQLLDWALARTAPALFNGAMLNGSLVDWVASAADHIPELPMTSRGPSTAEETLELIKDEVPDVKNFVDLKHNQKMLSTYIDSCPTDTIHASFVNIHSTARTGCRTPNLQNVPEEYRSQFRAREGRQLADVDFSMLELCTISAHILHFYPQMPCRMAEAINADKDVHAMTASFVSGMPFEQIVAGKKVKGSREAEIRQSGKPLNFGAIGGLGADRMVDYAWSNYGVRMTAEEAKKNINIWKYQAWPEMGTYLKDMSARVRATSDGKITATLINGRSKAGCSYTEAANFSMQGLAADGLKEALWDIFSEMMLAWHYHHNPTAFGWGAEYRDSPLWDSRLVNEIHDEVIGEHPMGDLGDKAFKRQKELMIAGMSRTCNHSVTIRVEGSLGQRWSH